MSTLKVCIVSPLFHPHLGGVGRQAVLLTAKLREYGVELFVLSRKMKDLPEFHLPDTVDVHYLPAYNPTKHILETISFSNLLTTFSFSLMVAFKLFVMRKSYDLVHFHGAGVPLIICIPLLILLRKKIVAKVLASRLGNEAGALRGRYFLMGNIMAYIVTKVDSFIAISQEIADGLKNDGVHTEKIVNIPNFIDTEKFYPVSSQKRHIFKDVLSLNKEKIINFTGRIVERKGVEILVRAFAKNRGLLISSNLIIVGIGPEESKIRNLLVELDIADNVRFIGQVANVEELYQLSDIFVLPSYAEGMPNALLEAMACGLPVIASRIGGVVDVVEEGKTGILFEPGNVAELSSALKRLLEDGALRRKLGAEARKTIIEKFSIDKVAYEYIGLYKKLLST
jgi:glycosyltransferase involved in cell wall biosynthesis